MRTAGMVDVRGHAIEFEISEPKRGPFPLVTPRGDGICCVETWPAQRWVPIDGVSAGGSYSYQMATVVYLTRIVWYFYEPSVDAVHPWDPDQPPIAFDPPVLEARFPDQAREQHAYMVDAIDLGLLHSFREQEAGREKKIAGTFYWDLPGRPIRRPGGGFLCPHCRERIEAAWGPSTFCSHCGACLSVSSEV